MAYSELNDSFQKKIQEIQKRYEPQIKALAAEGKDLEDNYSKPNDLGILIGVDVRVDWKDVEISFDLPKISFEDKAVSLDLPEITRESQHIAFDVPDVRMVDKKVGQYPEIHWPNVEWKDIIISVPEPYMRRVDIYFDVPSITMRRKDFVLGLPKVESQRIKWVVGLPQFTVVNVSAETSTLQGKGHELQQRGQSLAAQMKQEIEAEAAKFQAALIAENFSTKTEVGNQFNAALGDVRQAIDQLRNQGCDPIKVPTQNGDINLRKIYDDLDAGKSRALLDIEHCVGVVS